MAAKRKKPSGVGRVLGIVILAAFVLGLVGLAFVDYRAALALVIGAVVAWLGIRVVRGLLARSRRGGRSLLRGALIVVAIVVVVGAGALLLLTMFNAAGETAAPLDPMGIPTGGAAGEGGAPIPRPPQRELNIRQVVLSVRPIEGDVQHLSVREEIVFDVTVGDQTEYNGLTVTYPERTVESAQRGFLLREATLEPLGRGYRESFELSLPDGTEMATSLCSGGSCPLTLVRLEDFAARSFVDARGATNVVSEPYLNTETISWSTRSLSRGVTFAYMPPPLHHLRPLIGPLIGASGVSEWVVGLVGMFGTAVATPVVRPLVENWLEDRAAETVIDTVKKRRRKKSNTSSRR